ncbi:MAG: SH3 domain-containing protein [Bacteroidota bacterium]
MRFTTLLLVLAGLSACQADQTKSESQANETSTSSVPTITDSITHLYQTYLGLLEDRLPPQCVAERGKVNAADAAPQDTLFFVFRENLKKVIRDKDIFGLLPHVHQNIKTGFGAENGLQSFIQMWELDSPEKIPQSRLWPTLESVLVLGGTFHGSGNEAYFEAPYLGPCWPDDAEPYEYGAVTGAGVRFRSGPSLNTQILKNLSYDLVKYIETTPIEENIGGESHPWVKVQLVDGTEGFLYGKFYRSPLDFRAGFQKGVDGQWKLVSLLAGD